MDMKRPRRLAVLVLLLVLLIPTTVSSSSGDGDIPERRPQSFTGNQGPFGLPDLDLSWQAIWDLFVQTLILLP
jgi:hypothetical protein